MQQLFAKKFVITKNMAETIQTDYFKIWICLNELPLCKDIIKILSILCLDLFYHENINNHFNTIKSIQQQLSINTIPNFVNKKLKFVRTESLHVNCSPNRRYAIDLYEHDNIANRVIKNIRFNNQHILDNIELEIAGPLIDKIFNKINGTFDVMRYLLGIDDPTILPFACTSGNNYIPYGLLRYHRIKLRFQYGTFDPNTIDDSYITYDVCEIDEPLVILLDKLSFISQQLQFTGEEPYFTDRMKIKFNFRYYVTHIFYYSPTGIDHLYLTFHYNQNETYLYPIIEKYGDFYIIPFTKCLELMDGINFSPELDCIMHIYFKNDMRVLTENEMSIFALNWNVFHVENGMLRLGFNG
jgi:hypothetical protein